MRRPATWCRSGRRWQRRAGVGRDLGARDVPRSCPAPGWPYQPAPAAEGLESSRRQPEGPGESGPAPPPGAGATRSRRGVGLGDSGDTRSGYWRQRRAGASGQADGSEDDGGEGEAHVVWSPRIPPAVCRHQIGDRPDRGGWITRICRRPRLGRGSRGAQELGRILSPDNLVLLLEAGGQRLTPS